jgi:hypothetical protein
VNTHLSRTFTTNREEPFHQVEGVDGDGGVGQVFAQRFTESQ